MDAGGEGDADALAGGEGDADALAGGEDDADALAGGEDNEDVLAGGEDNGDALAGGEDNGDALATKVQDSPMQEDVITKCLEFLTTTFPDGRFNQKWKEDNVRNVFDDLAAVCHNALAIFTDVSPEVPAPVNVPEVVYPSIDWSQVNTRNLSNLPVPGTHAVHGCSQDPSHYEQKQVQGYNKMEWRPSQFEQNYPFGHLPGFLTDMGVIAFSPEVIHGHVWDVQEHKWVLHAGVKKVEDRQQWRQEKRQKRWRPGERQEKRQKR